LGRGRLSRTRCTTLASKIYQIFLAGLKGCGIGACGPFRVHRKPDWPNNDPDNARGDILGDLGILLGCEGLSAAIVRLDFGIYHRAIAVGVLRLHSRHRLRIAAGASRQSEASDSYQDRAHSPLPRERRALHHLWR
jgi:hypothetical protein